MRTRRSFSVSQAFQYLLVILRGGVFPPNFLTSVLSVAGLVYLSGCLPAPPTRPPAPTGTGGEVHGYVYTTVGDERTDKIGKEIFLPDITVYLKNAVTGLESTRVKTDLKGFFMAPKQPAGRYKVCVEAPGYVSSCPETASISSDLVYLPLIEIIARQTIVTGEVMLWNGGPSNFEDPSFGVRFHTTASVTDAGGTDLAPAVRANAAGQYVIPAVPPGAALVRAASEGAVVQQSTTVIPGLNQVNLRLPNSPPTNVTMVTSDSGQPVRRVAPGTTVKVSVDARDDEALHYRWSVSDAGKPFISRGGVDSA